MNSAEGMEAAIQAGAPPIVAAAAASAVKAKAGFKAPPWQQKMPPMTHGSVGKQAAHARKVIKGWMESPQPP